MNWLAILNWFQSEPHLLLASIVFGVAQLTFYAQFGNAQQGYIWAAGSRDSPKPPLSGIAGRMERAYRNFMETFPFFAALVVMSVAMGRAGGLTLLGAELYFVGRVLFWFLYVFGVFLVRSLAWNIATAGIFVMLYALAFPR